jgi:hypothetical protein
VREECGGNVPFKHLPAKSRDDRGLCHSPKNPMSANFFVLAV